MARHRSNKRRGRPGSAVTPVRPQQAPRATTGAPPARSTSPVVSEPQPRPWSFPAVLMLGATLWSCFILWQAFFRWEYSAIGSAGGERPWMLPVMIVASGVCSFAAYWMIRDGSTNSVRVPLWLAVFTGIQGILVTACALTSLWILWRRRVKARWLAAGYVPPTRRSARR